MRVRGEEGQLTVLVLGIALVCFATAGLAVDGTRAFLLRRTLQNSADGASLAAAGALDKDSYYSSGGDAIVLDPVAARRTALEWLGMRGIRARANIEAERRSIAVVLRAEMPTSFLGLLGIRSISVAAEARSEPVPGAP